MRRQSRPSALRIHVVIGGAISLVLAADAIRAADEPLRPDEEPAQRAKLVGVWKGFTVEGSGETPDRGPVKLEITISEKTMRGIQIREDGNIDHGAGEFTLNLAAEPAQLDAAKTGGRGRQQAYLGIYQLDGDTLRWCVSPQKTRPETFETRKGQFLLVLRRAATNKTVSPR